VERTPLAIVQPQRVRRGEAASTGICPRRVGGISPFGQMRRIPTAIEARALEQELVYIKAGQRGLQVRLKPEDALFVLDAIAAPVVA
jgi:prolyl-tRNA editing enzyme YbaK/EbsC (Cys-tRNA(Pro) deacylase)